MKPRAIVYIDGYNWYHAVFKQKPEWKWLNIQSFFAALRPDDDLTEIKLFSALMHEHDARARQEKYFEALGTLPKVRIILGMFQMRTVTCRAVCKTPYNVPEEKKTDVNIAVEMMQDAFQKKCENMYVISGDSDVQPVVEWIAANTEIKVTVYVPALPNEQPSRRTDYYRLKGLKVDCKFLPLGNLKDHQFKYNVLLSSGKFVSRPHSWSEGGGVV